MPRLLRIHQSLDRGGGFPKWQKNCSYRENGHGNRGFTSYKIWTHVIFHSFLYVYQRLKDSSFRIIISGGYTFKFAFKGFFKDMFDTLFLRYGMVHPATLVLEVWIFILGPFQCGIQRYSVFRESGWWDFIYISIVIHLCLACGCWWNYIHCYPFMFSMWLLMGLYPLLSIDVLCQWLLYPFVAHGYCTLFSSVGRKTDSGGVTLLTK